MKVTETEFKKLQQDWYKRLEQDGFKDIEKSNNGQQYLKQSASHCYNDTNDLIRHTKEEYYSILYEIAHHENTVYKNRIHQFILMQYSSGALIKDIVEALKTLGATRHRHSIRFIIRRYEMKWKINYYTKRQLNLE